MRRSRRAAASGATFGGAELSRQETSGSQPQNPSAIDSKVASQCRDVPIKPTKLTKKKKEKGGITVGSRRDHGGITVGSRRDHGGVTAGSRRDRGGITAGSRILA